MTLGDLSTVMQWQDNGVRCPWAGAGLSSAGPRWLTGDADMGIWLDFFRDLPLVPKYSHPFPRTAAWAS